MAEMGREGTVGEQDRITEVFQRVPGVPKTQSGLREAEIPEGIVELPGSTPEIEPRKTDASGSLEGGEDLEKLCCELGGKELPISRKQVTTHEMEAPVDDI